MTATKSKEQATSLQHIDVEKIDVEAGFNPRGIFDQEKLDELAASVKTFGILMPILVAPAKDGRFKLVAGERRLKAAQQAKLTTIPAQVRDANGQALTFAVIENLHRADLNPVEEGHAYKRAIKDGKLQPKALAKALNVSSDRIDSRLALLDLPDQAQDAIAAGKLTLSAAAALLALMEQRNVPAAVIDGMAALVIDGKAQPQQIAANPASLIDTLIGGDVDEADGDGMVPCPACEGEGDVQTGDPDSEGDEAWTPCATCGGDGRVPLDTEPRPFIATGAAGYSPARVEFGWFTDEQRDALQKLADEAPIIPGVYQFERPLTLKLSRQDMDEAVAGQFGFAVPGSWNQEQRYVSDLPFIFDRVTANLTADVKERKKAVKAYEKKGGEQADKVAVANGSKAEADVKAAKKKASEKARQDAIKARQRNVELGAALRKKLAAPKIDKASMKLVATLLVDDEFGDQLAQRGLRYIDGDRHETVTRKDGSISKIKHPTYGFRDGREEVLALIDKAATPEEVMGVLLQTLVACRFADTDAVPQSQRSGSVRGINHATGEYGRTATDRDKTALATVEKIGAKLLPESVKEHEAK